MKLSTVLSALLFAVFFTVSAQAACGGGGYHPAPQSVTTTTTTYRPAVTSGAPTEYRQAPSTDGFDTARFNNVSGKLHLTYDQATKVIATMNDVRMKARDPQKDKGYDPQKDFDTRLAGILSEEQFKDYKTYASN